MLDVTRVPRNSRSRTRERSRAVQRMTRHLLAFITFTRSDSSFRQEYIPRTEFGR